MYDFFQIVANNQHKYIPHHTECHDGEPQILVQRTFQEPKVIKYEGELNIQDINQFLWYYEFPNYFELSEKTLEATYRVNNVILFIDSSYEGYQKINKIFKEASDKNDKFLFITSPAKDVKFAKTLNVG